MELRLERQSRRRSRCRRHIAQNRGSECLGLVGANAKRETRRVEPLEHRLDPCVRLGQLNRRAGIVIAKQDDRHFGIPCWPARPFKTARDQGMQTITHEAGDTLEQELSGRLGDEVDQAAW
jgi:hypothetical protein